MLISDSHKLILMLPQKCGSATLQKRFSDIHDVKEYGSKFTRCQQTGKFLSKHIKLQQAVQLDVFVERKDYLKACFVRNPYDRTYSWFNWIASTTEQVINRHKRRLSKKPSKGIPLASNKKFKAAENRLKRLQECDFKFNRFVQKYPEKFTSISHYTHLNEECMVDFIGHVESFEADFIRLCESIGYTPSVFENANILEPSSNRENCTTDSPKYLDQYEPATINIVNMQSAEDFTNFGYRRIEA